VAESYTIRIISDSQEEIAAVRGCIDASQYQIVEQCVALDSPVASDQADVGACVLAFSTRFQPGTTASGFPGVAMGLPVLFVMQSPQEDMRLWAFKQGATEVLLKPFTTDEFRYRLERTVAANRTTLQKHCEEEHVLAFLKSLQQQQITLIEPALDAQMPSGHFYPAVAGVMGKTPHDSEFLERVSALGLLARSITNRIRSCGVCGDSRLNYREQCPKCASIDILQEEMIHHFACAHIGTLQTFRQGADMVCPKCQVVIRHIGLDYEKPAAHFICHSCTLVFPTPNVAAQCMQCANTCSPAETLEQPLYRYERNSLADEAVREGRIAGVNLASLLKSTNTGLYSQQYFQHELERELARYYRYKNEFTVLLIRIDDLAYVRNEHAAQAAEYVNSIFNALSDGLRNLDTTCVWDNDLLAVLLSGTPGEGAKVVTNRMQANVKALEYLYSIHEPRITLSLITASEDLKNSTDFMNAAMRDLNE
jgi:diguanylate cyclase (GGDEF)-like protein